MAAHNEQGAATLQILLEVEADINAGNETGQTIQISFIEWNSLDVSVRGGHIAVADFSAA